MSRKQILIAAGVGVVLLAMATFPAFRQQLSSLQDHRRLLRGEELASVYCASCHIEPEPAMLPKRSWEMVLAYMGYMMGIDDIGYLADHPEFAQENVRTKRAYLIEEEMYPDTPLLSASDWEALRYYYVESATVEPMPQLDKPAMQWELPQFELVQSDYRADPPVTTLVHIREETSEAYIGDSAANTLAVIGSDGQPKGTLQRYGRGMLPVDIEFNKDSAYIASIGDLFATGTSKERLATISQLSLTGQDIDASSISVIIDDLYRMADMEVADLNDDGLPDFIACGFGTRRGKVSWFESQGDGSYAEHDLISRPGGVKARVHDFNGDGYPDIAVLLSDAREGFYILLNDGSNEFASHTVFETLSSYGHVGFELQDFNGDGLVDIMTVNGDNVDSDPYNTLKNFHGVRIYLNRGNLQFDEAYFYPMYGAFGGNAADFDNDGDIDIAAISFYPDFEAANQEVFVFLRNDGDMQFSAFSSPELAVGRWMTMGVGDLDGDADIDIILGGAMIPTGMFAYMDTYGAMAESAPSILVLKNTLRQ